MSIEDYQLHLFEQVFLVRGVLGYHIVFLVVSKLPNIGIQGGLQVINNPDNFEYHSNHNDSFARNEEENPFQRHDEPLTPPHRQNQQRQFSPNKTAGQIELRDLQPEDISSQPFIGRDAVIAIEGEMRQFDNKKTEKVQRYIESLVTGKFFEVKKDINMQLQSKEDDEKTKKLQSNREFFDKQMKEIQRTWVNRNNKLFNMFLGFLAGMSIMHLIVVLSQNDKISFLSLYSGISNIIQLIFMVFASFLLILSTSLTLIYRQKSDEKMRNMDIFRVEFRQHYVVSTLCTILISINLVILYILPRYTNVLYYWDIDKITDSQITGFKGLSAAKDVIYIICWLIASAFNKASITDMDLDPEELEDASTREDTDFDSQ